MRKAAPVFHAAQQQSVSIAQQHGASVQNAVDPVRPLFPAENGVIGIAIKEKVLGNSLLMGLLLHVRL